MEHDKWQDCGSCDMQGYQIPSAFRMPCAKRENWFGVDIPVADNKDPWEGTRLERGGAPSLKDQLTKGSDRIQVDMASKGNLTRSKGMSEADRIVVA